MQVLDSIDSTSSELMRQARLGHHERHVLVAFEQTQGRGRRGNAWHSNAKDSLTFSMGFLLQPKNWLGLSLCLGIELIRCLDPEQRLGLQLKWPNDIWAMREGQYKKLAGILIETINATPAMNARYCVAGIGINLHTPPLPPNTLSPQALGLSELGAVMPAKEILLTLGQRLPATLARFEREGFAPFKSSFERLNILLGLQVHLSDGSTGICQGINEQGELIISKEGVMRALSSTEVSVRPWSN